jgi:hypothetical protein
MDAAVASQAPCQNEGKHVSFSEIRILYFQREQGNQTVPREGMPTQNSGSRLPRTWEAIFLFVDIMEL